MATSSAFAAQFPEDEFRTAIRETMRMGMPESDDEKLKWWWEHARTWERESPAGHPYDLTAAAVTDTIGNPTQDPGDDGLIVDYTLESNDLSAQVDESNTALGLLNFNKVKVTLFDVDFVKVKDADYATIGTTRYLMQTTTPPYGLFGVTMHDVYLQAVDSG